MNRFHLSKNRAKPISIPRFGAELKAGDTLHLSDVTVRRHQANLEKLRTYTQLAAKLAPNYSGRHYGALVILADGTEGLGTNVEASRQVTLCDLRLALSTAQNSWVERQMGKPDTASKVPAVRTIYLVNADVDGDQPIPCADCQEWLASPLCPPDTEVVSLERGPEGGAPLIRSRTVREMLPLYKERSQIRFTTSEPLSELPVQYSGAAKALQEPLPEAQVRQLLAKAQKAYQAGQSLAKESKRETGAAVLLSPSGVITTGNRVDWSTRWHESADLSAAAEGLSQVNRLRQQMQRLSLGQWWPAALGGKRQQQPASDSIRAVAYYGDDSSLPPIASLGRIARKRGSAQTLIVTVERGCVQIRTIQDLLPELYRRTC